MSNGLQLTNLRDQALALLRYRLVSGELVPGQVYSAAALAAELGVSNSPVREAMLALVNLGVMETVKNRGFRVIQLDEAESRHVYEVRLMLEVPAMLRLTRDHAASVSARQAEFATLADDILRTATQGDLVSYLTHDRQFHLGLIEILGNGHLHAIIANLRERSRQYGLRALSQNGRLVDSAAEHRLILDRICAGDQQGVAQVMRHHLGHLVGIWAGAADGAFDAV